MSKYSKQPKPCQQCGKIMLVVPSLWERKRFCSRSCLGIENAARMNKIRRSPSEYATPPVMLGEDNPKWKPSIIRVCKYCENSFNVKPGELNERHKGFFCSVKCRGGFRSKFLSGSNSPHWVGGKKTYRGKSWTSAREIAITRDKGKCQTCGVFKGGSISVHHIRPFREFQSQEQANVLENLVCLCQSCHMKSEWPQMKTFVAP